MQVKREGASMAYPCTKLLTVGTAGVDLAVTGAFSLMHMAIQYAKVPRNSLFVIKCASSKSESIV